MSLWHGRLDRIVQGRQQKPRIVEILQTPGIDVWEPGTVRTTWPVNSDFFSIGGSLFGGYVAVLADQVASHTALTVLPDDEVPRTVHLSTSFFKPIFGGDLNISGHVVSLGKDIVHIVVEFRNGEDLSAESRAIISRRRVPEEQQNLSES